MKRNEPLTYQFVLAAFFAAGSLTPLHAHAVEECLAPGINQINMTVNTGQTIRKGVPTEIFGFNVPWRDFQLGYIRNGVVRADLYPFLAPFKGAAYRYPGGNPSNNFEWSRTVGVPTLRPPLLADYNNVSQPLFGIDEFANFIHQLNSRAILTLNISGPARTPKSAATVTHDALGLISHIRHSSIFRCVTGNDCPLMGVELGNELDLGAYSWTANQYSTRAAAVIDSVNETPGLSGINWIVGGRTAPWGFKDTNAFNAELAEKLGSKVLGIAIHPYYDGIDIPYALRFVNDFGKTWAASQPNGKIYVTEHARWPKVPQNGDWRKNWHQATSIGGAISTVDFLIGMIRQPMVAAGNWHALGLSGPWQLIRVNKKNDSLYGSPVYWGMLTAREAFLDNLVSTKYTTQKVKATYSGGYDINIIGMSANDNSAASVIGINRGPTPQRINIIWQGNSRSAGTATLRTVSSENIDADNTDNAPTALMMIKTSKAVDSNRASSTWCVPALSVFSIIEP